MNTSFLRPLLLLLAAALSFPLFSQEEPNPDALRRELSLATSDTAKARLMIKTANAFLMQGVDDSATHYAEEAIAHSMAGGDRKLQRSAYSLLGTIFIRRGEYTRGQNQLEKALVIARDMHDQKAQARIMANIGICYSYRKEFAAAIDQFNKTLDLAADDPHLQYGVLSNLASCFSETGAYDKALAALDKAYAIASEIRDDSGRLQLTITRASILHKKKDDGKAIALLKQALLMADSIGDRISPLDCNMDLGDIAKDKKDLKAAAGYYRKAYDIAAEFRYTDRMLSAAANLSETFGLANDTKAREVWSHRRDSVSYVIDEQERQERKVRLAANREKEKIQQLKREAEMKKMNAELEQRKQTRLMLIAVPVILACLGGGALIFFLSRRNRNKVY